MSTETVSGPNREFILRLRIDNQSESTLETMKSLLINLGSNSTWDSALTVGATAADDPRLICGPNCDDVELVLLRIEANNTVTLGTRLSALEPNAEYRVALLGVRFIENTTEFFNVIDSFRAPV